MSTHYATEAVALCVRHPYDPALWDHEVHGETYQQRKARLRVAADVCARCPLREGCATVARPGREEGIWGGRLLPGIRMQAAPKGGAA